METRYATLSQSRNTMSGAGEVRLFVVRELREGVNAADPNTLKLGGLAAPVNKS